DLPPLPRRRGHPCHRRQDPEGGTRAQPCGAGDLRDPQPGPRRRPRDREVSRWGRAVGRLIASRRGGGTALSGEGAGGNTFFSSRCVNNASRAGGGATTARPPRPANASEFLFKEDLTSRERAPPYAQPVRPKIPTGTEMARTTGGANAQSPR